MAGNVQKDAVSRDHVKVPRVLFVVSTLRRKSVSVRGIREGKESITGTHNSLLLVADQLAARGHEVGVLLGPGEVLSETAARTFTALETAARWADGGITVWCSWGDTATLSELNSAGIAPILWIHVYMTGACLRWLESRALNGIITVSDTARLPFLHSSAWKRIGRVYNPLNPFFCQKAESSIERYRSETVTYSGYVGESKGVHHLLKLWPKVRERLPGAVLTIAGSEKLYGETRPTGPFGVGSPEFEDRYFSPLARRFGSLEQAGVRLAGLLSPSQLLELYRRSALGIVNLNWDAYAETFCCAAVEMLATGLPVFGVERGALPETVGCTGGAILCERRDLDYAANMLVDWLRHPERLQRSGVAGSRYVVTNYNCDRIVDQWVQILAQGPERLDGTASPWKAERNLRYWTERAAGWFGCGRALELGLALARHLTR